MRNVQKNKAKDKVAVSLLLCFCVVALTSIFTIKSNLEKIDDDAEGALTSEQIKTENVTEIPSSNEKTEKKVIPSSASNVVDSKDKDSSTKKPSTALYINPVKSKDAKVMKAYSMDNIIYSVTLDQYMTHSGTDITAPADTQVVAIAKGTVTKVYSDGGYGITIEIDHGNGLISRYSNLSTDKMVEVGDNVKQGEIISGIGDTAMFENAEAAHLHLELLKNGKYVNPSKYIKL